MKTSMFGMALVALSPAVLALSNASSPTTFYGCEPHGDHWHCDGTRATTTAIVPTNTAAGDDHDHEHGDEHEHHTDEAGPSPTESIGCEPHGDHWHCDGPASLAAVTPTASHSDDAGTGSAGPSPTESYGCVAHGDHYHCEGLRATTTGGSASIPAPDTGAGMRAAVPVLAVIAAIAAAV